MDERYTDKQLVSFEQECILAGTRTSIIGFFNLLKKLGANIKDADKAEALISSKQRIVILCQNVGLKTKFAQIAILDRSWWDYYHNPKKKLTNKSVFKTFNVPKQWEHVCNNILNVKDIPLLIPE